MPAASCWLHWQLPPPPPPHDLGWWERVGWSEGLARAPWVPAPLPTCPARPALLSRLQALHARMQPLVFFFVDGASAIDADDPDWYLVRHCLLPPPPPLLPPLLLLFASFNDGAWICQWVGPWLCRWRLRCRLWSKPLLAYVPRRTVARAPHLASRPCS